MSDAIAGGVAVILLMLSGLYWLFAGMPARVFRVARDELARARAEDEAAAEQMLREAPLASEGDRPAHLPVRSVLPPIQPPPRMQTIAPPPMRAPDAEEPDSGRATAEDGTRVMERPAGLLARESTVVGTVYNIGELDPHRDDEGPVSRPRIVGIVSITSRPPPPAPPEPVTPPTAPSASASLKSNTHPRRGGS